MIFYEDIYFSSIFESMIKMTITISRHRDDLSPQIFIKKGEFAQHSNAVK